MGKCRSRDYLQKNTRDATRWNNLPGTLTRGFKTRSVQTLKWNTIYFLWVGRRKEWEIRFPESSTFEPRNWVKTLWAPSSVRLFRDKVNHPISNPESRLLASSFAPVSPIQHASRDSDFNFLCSKKSATIVAPASPNGLLPSFTTVRLVWILSADAMIESLVASNSQSCKSANAILYSSNNSEGNQKIKIKLILFGFINNPD